MSKRLGKLKILTYNIFIRPPGINEHGNDFKDERLVQFEKLIDQYDVICLQELFGAFSSRQNKFIAIAYEKGFKYHVASPKVGWFSGFLVDGGCCILSKYAIVASDSVTFEKGMHSDQLSAKGALHALIEIPIVASATTAATAAVSNNSTKESQQQQQPSSSSSSSATAMSSKKKHDGSAMASSTKVEKKDLLSSQDLTADEVNEHHHRHQRLVQSNVETTTTTKTTTTDAEAAHHHRHHHHHHHHQQANKAQQKNGDVTENSSIATEQKSTVTTTTTQAQLPRRQSRSSGDLRDSASSSLTNTDIAATSSQHHRHHHHRHHHDKSTHDIEQHEHQQHQQRRHADADDTDTDTDERLTASDDVDAVSATRERDGGGSGGNRADDALPMAVRVHVFCTHLQSSYNPAEGLQAAPFLATHAIRMRQLATLRRFVERRIARDQHDCLLVGDFNIDARPHTFGSAKHERFDAGDRSVRLHDNAADESSSGGGAFVVSDQYNEMMSTLESRQYRLVDTLRAAAAAAGHHTHPITIGDVHLVDDSIHPREQMLTDKEGWRSRQCLDYILLCRRIHADDLYTVALRPITTYVEPFFVEHPPNVHLPRQLSDHYGIVGEFSITRRSRRHLMKRQRRHVKQQQRQQQQQQAAAADAAKEDDDEDDG